MKGMSSGGLYSGYNPDTGVTYSQEWNLSPQYTVAQATLFHVTGGGLHKTGIMAYRTRAGGTEQAFNFGSWPTWPSYVYADKMSSITFATAVGANQVCSMTGNLFFW
jgi:hypothetical protein